MPKRFILLAAAITGTVITTCGVAQTVTTVCGPTPIVGLQMEPAATRIVEPNHDAQQQARDLLTGSASRHIGIVHQSPSVAGDEPGVRRMDPQEQAQRLILGVPNSFAVSGRPAPRTHLASTVASRRTTSDPQELARRMIVGERVATTQRQKQSEAVANENGKAVKPICFSNSGSDSRTDSSSSTAATSLR